MNAKKEKKIPKKYIVVDPKNTKTEIINIFSDEETLAKFLAELDDKEKEELQRQLLMIGAASDLSTNPPQGWL